MQGLFKYDPLGFPYPSRPARPQAFARAWFSLFLWFEVRFGEENFAESSAGEPHGCSPLTGALKHDAIVFKRGMSFNAMIECGPTSIGQSQSLALLSIS